MRVRYVELFEEMVLNRSRTPRWSVVASFFWRLGECFSELLEVVVGEFRRASRRLVIVERGLEAALFEPIQPPINRLFVPPELGFNLRRRTPVKVFAYRCEAFDCLRIRFVRELLADLLDGDLGDFPPYSVIGH